MMLSLITIYLDKSKQQQATIHFTENKAQRGGGVCLESAAQIRIEKTQSNVSNIGKTNLYFTSNSADVGEAIYVIDETCLLYTSPSPRDATLSRMPSSA